MADLTCFGLLCIVVIYLFHLIRNVRVVGSIPIIGSK